MPESVRVALDVRSTDASGSPLVDVTWILDSGILRGSWPLDRLDSMLPMGWVSPLPGIDRSNRDLLSALHLLNPAQLRYAQQLVRYMIGPSRQMRRLLEDPTDPPRIALSIGEGALRDVPWEIVPVGPPGVHDTVVPLCTSGGSLTRVIEGLQSERTWSTTPRIVVGGAAAPGHAPLEGAQRFVAAVGATLGQLTFTGAPLRPEIRWQMTSEELSGPIDTDIAVLVAHGTRPDLGPGMVFVDSTGAPSHVGADQLAAALASTRLVVLLSCYSGSGTVADAGLAEILASKGVGAVVSFGGEIDWDDARAIAERMLTALTEGADLEEAVAAARRRVEGNHRPSWAQIRLVQRGFSPLGM